MARIVATAQDLDAAQQIVGQRGTTAGPDRWTLIARNGLAATVRLEGHLVAVWADADGPERALPPGDARRLALALLEHADRAERQ